MIMRNLLLTGLSVLTLSTVLTACQPAQTTKETVKETVTATKAALENTQDQPTTDNEMNVNCLLYTSPSPRD